MPQPSFKSSGPDHLPFDLVLEHLCHEAGTSFALVSWKGSILRSSPDFAECGLNLSADPTDGWVCWEVPAGVVWLRLDVDDSEEETRREDSLKSLSSGLRASLHSIAGASELLVDGEHCADQDQAMEVLELATCDLVRLVEDVLNLSRVRNAHVDVIAERLDLGKFLESLLNEHRERAFKKDIDLRLESATGLPPVVHLDRTRLYQVLDNLLSNAIQFTHEGRVVLGVSRPHLGRLRFEVRDSGVGVTRQEQDQIFNAFGTGSGLGLAIAKRSVAAIGGELRLDSLPSVGSTFSFEIPLIPSLELVEEAPEEEPILDGLQILLVEPDRSCGIVTRRMLEAGGARVVWVHSGYEALAAIVQQPYSLVLMDLGLPDMSGPEASTAIRALGGPLGEIPILAFSASFDGAANASAKSAGVNACLPKPIRYRDLCEAVTSFAPAAIVD